MKKKVKNLTYLQDKRDIIVCMYAEKNQMEKLMN